MKLQSKNQTKKKHQQRSYNLQQNLKRDALWYVFSLIPDIGFLDSLRLKFNKRKNMEPRMFVNVVASSGISGPDRFP